MPLDAYTGAGIGAAGIGSALGSIGSVISQDAMSQAYADEIAKQAALQKQAMGVFNKNVSAVGAGGAAATGTANRLAQYNQAGPLIPGVPQGSRIGSGLANQNLMSTARAKDMGFSDIPVAQRLALQQQQQELTPITGAAGSEARNVFPLAMYGAQNAGLPFQQIGAGLGQVGGALSLYGLYNKLYGKNIFNSGSLSDLGPGGITSPYGGTYPNVTP